MKYGMLTFNTVSDVVTQRTPFRRLCRAAAASGVSELDMMTGEVKLYGEKRVAKALDESGLTLGCLIAHIPMSVTKDDKVARLTDKSLALALRLKSPLLMIVPMTTFGAGKLRPRDKEKIFENYVKYYTAAVRAAAGSGVTVCFEDTPTCYLPLSSTDECARLLNEVDGLGLVFDTANMLPGGSDPTEFYEKLKARVVRAHLKDARYVQNGQDRCADGRYIECCDFGSGVVPVRELHDCLAEDNCPAAAIEYTRPQGHGYAAHAAHILEFMEYIEGRAGC